MTRIEITQKIANYHNCISGLFMSGDINLRSGDSVIAMGDIIRDMRATVQQLQSESEDDSPLDE